MSKWFFLSLSNSVGKTVKLYLWQWGRKICHKYTKGANKGVMFQIILKTASY